MGTGRWRFKSSHPDQFYGKWPSAQGAGFGYRRSRVEIPPSRPDCCGVEEWFLGGLIRHTGRFDSGPRYHFCPRRLAAGTLNLDQGTRIRLPPRVRSVGGVRPSSVPCHGTDHGFKSRTDRQILWPRRLPVRMGDFQSLEVGSTPTEAAMIGRVVQRIRAWTF